MDEKLWTVARFPGGVWSFGGSQSENGTEKRMSEILTEVERDAIRAVARADKTNLAAAREPFDRAVPRHGVDSCAELQFMAEVLAPARSDVALAISSGGAQTVLNRKTVDEDVWHEQAQ
ncbi:hypothetical protein [Burkholderia ubonensis]|uniref:hypothetical protein n=1 Tax=Burkholderia ubonensis TaxID=101571 RepID=UPI001E2D245C|nr:hypothetical protein [Burkholderia ubonensis]